MNLANLDNIIRNNSLKPVISAVTVISQSFHTLLLKTWSVTSSIGITWQLVRNAGSQGLLQISGESETLPISRSCCSEEMFDRHF